MTNKYFIITIDTEEDDQWNNEDVCTTENVYYLPRFQEMAEKYNFKPVWLTTYRMAKNKDFVNYFKKKQDDNKCEIGMHLHAWNTPPDFSISKKENAKPYLIEYPEEIMDKKIKKLDEELTKSFGIKPVSHRAGRWATNNTYFKLLKKYGYKIDCSVTPNINWEHIKGMTGLSGTNYKKNSENVYSLNNGIVEVPMTIRKIRYFDLNNIKNFKSFLKEIYYFILKKDMWIRPGKSSTKKSMKKIMDECIRNKDEYIMFMIHSSELMPGCNPSFKTQEDIEKLYVIIDYIFSYMKKNNYIGITLKDFVDWRNINE